MNVSLSFFCLLEVLVKKCAILVAGYIGSETLLETIAKTIKAIREINPEAEYGAHHATFVILSVNGIYSRCNMTAVLHP